MASARVPRRLTPSCQHRPLHHLTSLAHRTIRTRCFSTSPSPPPPPTSSPSPTAPPLSPPSLSHTLDSLRSFPEVQTALAALPSSPALALPPLLRALEVLSRIPDPLPLLLTLRLLCTTLHLHPSPPPHLESSTHLHLLTHTLTLPPSPSPTSPDALILRAQTAFSYLTLPPPLQSHQGTHLAREEVQRIGRSGGQQRLRANAMALEAATSSSPSPRTLEMYEEALALLSSGPTSESSSSAPSPLSLYLDRLLTPADLRLLIADLHSHSSPPIPSSSSTSPSSSLTPLYEAAVAAYQSLPSPALPLVTGDAHLPLAYALTALSRTSTAVSLTEQHLGEAHAFMATVLRWAGEQQQREGEAIAAEGLMRASVGRLEREGVGVRGARQRRGELMRSMWSYARLLDQLEWNERSRRAEGDHWRAKAEEVAGQDAVLSATLAELRAGQRPRDAPLIPQWMVERFSV